ncbi:RNA exonuclease 4 [Odontesthes bonariensis]|uniref:RNA exonuclease 4 n=1 Tax=Odontesthes bonariensis TaxID=219752 RepID=UPI003F584FFB
MSKLKANNTQSKTDTNKITAKEKRKTFWKSHTLKKQKFKKTANPPKRQEKAGASQQIAPPEDPQLFSSNWKALQEVLKASQPEKKQPVTRKHQNGISPKKAKEHLSKNISENNAAPNQADTEKNVKNKSAPNSVVPKKAGVNLKVQAASDTRQPAAPKRKKDNGKSNSDQAAKKKKKKKSVVEERKPTEDDLWFDDVDLDDIEETMGAEAAEIMRKKQGIQKKTNTDSALVKEKAFDGLTRIVAIDCEMVGVGPDGEDSILARVSIVNQFGKCIYDKYVRPTEKVTDYRTAVSGIRPEDIKEGEDVPTVQREVAEILQGRVVVGHAIHNDLKILLLDHPKKKIRDTQKYKPFRRIVGSARPSLKVLCREILNVKVQQGEHSSVQDAQATMRLYTLVKKQWEAEIKASKTNKDSDKKSKRKPK